MANLATEVAPAALAIWCVLTLWVTIALISWKKSKIACILVSRLSRLKTPAGTWRGAGVGSCCGDVVSSLVARVPELPSLGDFDDPLDEVVVVIRFRDCVVDEFLDPRREPRPEHLLFCHVVVARLVCKFSELSGELGDALARFLPKFLEANGGGLPNIGSAELIEEGSLPLGLDGEDEGLIWCPCKGGVCKERDELACPWPSAIPA
jgi:hypothetical protein